MLVTWESLTMKIYTITRNGVTNLDLNLALLPEIQDMI